MVIGQGGLCPEPTGCCTCLYHATHPHTSASLWVQVVLEAPPSPNTWLSGAGMGGVMGRAPQTSDPFCWPLWLQTTPRGLPHLLLHQPCLQSCFWLPARLAALRPSKAWALGNAMVSHISKAILNPKSNALSGKSFNFLSHPGSG